MWYKKRVIFALCKMGTKAGIMMLSAQYLSRKREMLVHSKTIEKGKLVLGKKIAGRQKGKNLEIIWAHVITFDSAVLGPQVSCDAIQFLLQAAPHSFRSIFH